MHYLEYIQHDIFFPNRLSRLEEQSLLSCWLNGAQQPFSSLFFPGKIFLVRSQGVVRC